MRIGILVGTISFGWVLVEAWLAYADWMFFPEQMLRKHPQYAQGLTFLFHGGMWGDGIFISPFMGWIAARYAQEWTLTHIFYALGVGVVLSVVMHLAYLQNRLPDPLIWHREISPAGWLHVVYMTAVVAEIALLFFWTPSVTTAFLILSAAILTLHVAVANHIPVGILNRWVWRYGWLPEFLNKPDPWATTAAAALAFIAAIGVKAWMA